MICNNITELTKELDKCIEMAIKDSADEVKEKLEEYIENYYNEYAPKKYPRTFQFRNSPKSISKKNKAEVYIDESMMHYKEATARQVLDWANQSLHGGMEVDGADSMFWDDFMEWVEFDLEDLIAKNLKKYGMEVTKN